MKGTIALLPRFQFTSRFGLNRVKSIYTRRVLSVPGAGAASASITPTGQAGFTPVGNSSISLLGNTFAAGDLLLAHAQFSVGLYNGGTDITLTLTDDAGNIWKRLGHAFIDTGNYSIVGREAFNAFAGQHTLEVFYAIHNGNAISTLFTNQATNPIPNSFDNQGTLQVTGWRPGRVPLLCDMVTFNSHAIGETAAVYNNSVGSLVPNLTSVPVNSNRIVILSAFCPLMDSLNGALWNMGGVSLATNWYILQAGVGGSFTQPGFFVPTMTSGSGHKAPFWFTSELVF